MHVARFPIDKLRFLSSHHQHVKKNKQMRNKATCEQLGRRSSTTAGGEGEARRFGVTNGTVYGGFHPPAAKSSSID